MHARDTRIRTAVITLILLLAASAAPAAVNDACPGAVVITRVPQTLQTAIAGTTSDASDPAVPCNSAPQHHTVWYRYSPGAPGQAHVMVRLKTPRAGDRLEPGQQVLVTWDAASNFTIGGFWLEFAHDGGFHHEYVETGFFGHEREYLWTVPDVRTTRGVLRLVPVMASGSTYAWTGPFAIGVAEVQNLRLEGRVTTTLSWDPYPGAGSYDVIRADRRALRSLPGPLGRIDLGEVLCVADGVSATSATDDTLPAAGSAWIYAVRPNTAGLGVFGFAADGKEKAPSSGACP